MENFFVQEWRKLLASLAVCAFFLFFWLNGPLQVAPQVLRQEHAESRFAMPKLVKHSEGETIRSFRAIRTETDDCFGCGLLLLDKKSERPAFGLLATDASNPGLSKALGAKVLAHSRPFVADSLHLELLPSFDLYYALSGQTIGSRQLYLESTDVVRGIRGYAGPVDIGVVLAEDGRIVSLHHVASEETASYLRMISQAGFYRQFEGLRLSDGPQQVDAVSGATLTSEAIAGTLTALSRKATPFPLSDYLETGDTVFFSVDAVLSRIWIAHAAVIFLLFFYGLQRRWKKSKRGMLVLQLLSVAYIGFFLNNSFTYVSFMHPFIGTSVSALVGLYAFFCLLGAIWGKNTYCKYVCPFGNAQRLLLRISPVKPKRFFIPDKGLYRLRSGLSVVLIAGVLLGLHSWSNFELFPDLFGLEWLSFWFFAALACVALTVYYPMIWCRLLCPTGSVLDWLSDAVKTRNNRR
ncbi:MAG: 4Fe-4S binding protein [Saprospiraceae bacterium]